MRLSCDQVDVVVPHAEIGDDTRPQRIGREHFGRKPVGDGRQQAVRQAEGPLQPLAGGRLVLRRERHVETPAERRFNSAGKTAGNDN